MNIFKRAIAATELLLIFPAALFMMALFVRNLQPLQYEPARTAQRIVGCQELTIEYTGGKPVQFRR
jgi:hypothetical protein